MPKDKSQDRAALLAERQIHLPEKTGAAYGETEKIVWTYFRKYSAERKYISDNLRDLIKDARGEGITTDEFRTAMRIRRMNEEKRLQYFANMSAAARLFGMEVTPSFREPHTKLNEFVNQAEKLLDDRKEITDVLKALSDAAKARNVDIAALKEVARVAKKAETSAEAADGDGDVKAASADWMARVDSMGNWLNAW